MRMRGFADLDNIDNMLSDFMDQLLAATRNGWYRTRPDHYRAILEAFDSALKARNEACVARASIGPRQGVPRPGAAEDAMSFALGWPWRPLLSPIVVSRGRR
jgi:hypothetical protein